MKRVSVPVVLAVVVTGGLAVPVIWYQQHRITELEKKLNQAAAPALPRSPAGTPLAARTPAPQTAASRPVNRRRQAWEEQQERLAPVKDKVTDWGAALLQVDDMAKKQQALDEILAGLAAPDPQEVFAALTAYAGAGQVEFDRTPFRPAITGLLSNTDPMLRRMALDLIAGLPRDPGDVDLVRAMAKDPVDSVRKSVVGSLFWLTKGDLTTGAGQTILEVLNRAEVPSRSLIDVMWGAQFTPELEEKLVGYARGPRNQDDEELSYYAVYSCLSTQHNKGPACVDLLIERLSDADSFNVGGRAAWGLAYGVQPGLGLEKKIADAALKVWRNRADGYLKNQLMKCLQQYGDVSHAEILEDIATAPAMGPEQRKQLSETAAALRRKTAPSGS